MMNGRTCVERFGTFQGTTHAEPSEDMCPCSIFLLDFMGLIGWVSKCALPKYGHTHNFWHSFDWFPKKSWYDSNWQHSHGPHFDILYQFPLPVLVFCIKPIDDQNFDHLILVPNQLLFLPIFWQINLACPWFGRPNFGTQPIMYVHVASSGSQTTLSCWFMDYPDFKNDL